MSLNINIHSFLCMTSRFKMAAVISEIIVNFGSPITVDPVILLSQFLIYDGRAIDTRKCQEVFFRI